MISFDKANSLSIQALGWLIAQEEVFPIFMNMSGVTLDDIKARVDDPEFLGHVLDFILTADEHVINCAGSISCAPQQIAEARAVLPGGQITNWT